ncbi:MAG TPA: hypothetical protein VHO70_22150, partial [Chitinispirillaceae bacterium]|nr:hypothetical protein [Chitinispirillaceae bacterium]
QNDIPTELEGQLHHDNQVFLPITMVCNCKKVHCRDFGEVCKNFGMLCRGFGEVRKNFDILCRSYGKLCRNWVSSVGVRDWSFELLVSGVWCNVVSVVQLVNSFLAAAM